jgi:hypothetical protein
LNDLSAQSRCLFKDHVDDDLEELLCRRAIEAVIGIKVLEFMEDEMTSHLSVIPEILLGAVLEDQSDCWKGVVVTPGRRIFLNRHGAFIPSVN